MSVKSVLIGAVAALSVFASGAQAAVITFQTSPTGLHVFSGDSEDGFNYEPDGAYFINVNGHPGHDARRHKGRVEEE